VLNGVILTNNAAVPIGTVQPFPSLDSVSAFFGAGSTEASLAAIYFAGRDNATVLPGNLLFSQYASAAVAGYLRGGSLAAMTLTQLQALTGTLTVTVDGGSAKTSSSINLSSATSFSNAATIIAAAFTSLGATISFDAQRAAFVFTSSTTGASSSLTFATGSLAAGLLLTSATGAVLSAGSVASVPGTAMDAIKAATLNWVSFMTTFEPITADKLAFSAWVNGQGKRFAYVGWDTDVAATESGNTTSWGYQANALGYDGTVPVYNTKEAAAFVLGMIASIDFTRTEGRITFAFKSLAGLASTVTDQTIAANLDANGYNFYGAYATANDGFTFFYPGSVTGKYSFLDEYINQIWLNNQLQLALMELLTSVNSLPYNAQGYALIDAACADPIEAALLFGAIRKNVPLSSLQAAEVNNAAGLAISNVLGTRGWYLQVLPAIAQVRGARTSPPITLWYVDGGSIQKITLASIVVQ
jgi:hypothetical protein